MLSKPALITVVGGVLPFLVVALNWRNGIPPTRRGHHSLEGPFVAQNNRESRDPPGSSDRSSVDVLPSSAALASAMGSACDPAMAVVADLRGLTGSGPAAKGEIDELMGRLRVLLAPDRAAKVAQALSSQELAAPVGTVVLEAWLDADSGAASAWIAMQPESTDHHAWLVAAKLARQPEKLAAFCETLGTDPWAEAFLDYCSRELLSGDPPAAAAMAESLKRGERRTRLIETIACEWVVRNPDAARAWIEGRGDPALRQRLVAVAAPAYASINPLGALEWLLAQSPANTVPQEPLRIIAGIWRHTANPETVAWLNDLMAGTDGRSSPVLRQH